VAFHPLANAHLAVGVVEQEVSTAEHSGNDVARVGAQFLGIQVVRQVHLADLPRLRARLDVTLVGRDLVGQQRCTHVQQVLVLRLPVARRAVDNIVAARPAVVTHSGGFFLVWDLPP